MPTHSAKVLIVDDEPMLLRQLGILLREERYSVLAAESGEKALELVAAEEPDIVLTDLRMSGINGLELFDALRNIYPLLPVIILTAHGTGPEEVECARRGVSGFITKPYDARKLLATVRRLIALDTEAKNIVGIFLEPQIASCGSMEHH